MATVYFVREGSGEGSTNDGQEVSLVEIAKNFPNCKLNWSQGAPTFNPKAQYNPVSNYRIVVVEVQREECSGKFTNGGYWVLEDVSPTEFEQKFKCE